MKVQLSQFFGKLRSKIRGTSRASTSSRNSFLSDVSGVIHVGANKGNERELYDRFGLDVVWVEPIPEIFDQLCRNIEGYNNQRAFQELITDEDGVEYMFHIANNNGASSSIYALKHHKDIWPQVEYVKTTMMKSITLATLCDRESIDITRYEALVLDTQGSELLVLTGAIPLLEGFKYVKCEVADFEAYDGCCQLPEMINFMTEYGFQEHHRHKFATRSEGGSYYDVVFKRVNMK